MYWHFTGTTDRVFRRSFCGLAVEVLSVLWGEYLMQRIHVIRLYTVNLVIPA